MKTIILHIGEPKTGTTSIQNTLAANKDFLEGHGVLYPLSEKGGERDHKWLYMLLEPFRKWPREFKVNSEEEAGKRLNQVTNRFKEIQKQISSSEYLSIVLSSEYFPYLSIDALKKLRALLGGDGVRFKIVCYVREPVDRYMSLQQQILKADSRIVSPAVARSNSREIYEKFSAVFGDVLTFRPFEKAQLVKGNVVDDLLKHLGIDIEAASALKKTGDANTSLSAEGVIALWTIRKYAFQDQNNRFSPAGNRVLQALVDAEADMNCTPPKLRKDVQRHILHENIDDLIWLRDRFSVNFNSIDYETLSEKPAEMEEFADLGKLIEFDQNIVEVLLAKAIRILSEPVA